MIGTRRRGADPAADLAARKVGQHHVEQDHVGLFALECDQAVGGVAGTDDPVAVALERGVQELLDGVLVVDDEHHGLVCHARMLPSAGRVDRAPRDRSARRRKPRRRRAGRATLVSERLYVAGLVVPAVALLIALVGLHAPGGIDLAPERAADLQRRAGADAGREHRRRPRSQRPAARPRRWPREIVRQAFIDVGRAAAGGHVPRRARDGGRSRCRTSRRCCGASRTRRSSSSPTATTCRPAPIARTARSARPTVVELAAAFADQRNARTLVFASVDGGGAGDAGARRLLDAPAAAR